MSRLPTLTYREVIVRLRQAGFVFDRQAKGSHLSPFMAYPCARVTTIR